jgi:hypothetical protein
MEPQNVRGNARDLAIEFLEPFARVAVPAKAQAQLAEGGVAGAQAGVAGAVRPFTARPTNAIGNRYNSKF